MVVFRLPKYVVLPVLIEWTSMVDLCRLDSAVCNRSFRPIYLSLVRSVAFTGLKDMVCGDSYLLWLDLRQMSVTYVNFVINRNRTRERLSSCMGALYDSLYGRKNVFPINKKVITDPNIPRQHYLAKLRYLKLNIEAKINERSLNQLADHCNALYEVSIIGNFVSSRTNIFIGTQVFMAIIRQCQDLTILTLERCTLTMKSFNYIFQQCVNLKSINFNNSTITDAETRHIQYNPNDHHYYTGVTSMNCCNLTTLSMCGVSVISGGYHAHQTAGVSGIQMNPVTTMHNNGGGRFRNRPDHNDELPELLFVSIIQNNPSLLHISMNYNQYCTNYALSQIAQCCPKLILLDVCYSYNLNDEGVSLISENCSKLQYVNMIDCNISELSIYQLATQCTNLIYLEVQQLNDSEINILTLNCKQLQAFKLVNNVLATTVGLTNIVTRCIHLRELIYSAYTLTSDQITNATVVTMASNCDQLRSFVCIQRWNAITDSSIQVLALKCSRLEKLVLTYNTILTDTSLHALATHCKNLTHLDISNCEYITDSPIMRISSSCPSLRVLDLYHCNEVSDLCIHHVITHSFRLASLTLPDTGVTEDILWEIGHYCNELKLLRVNQQFTQSQIAMLRRKRPNLVIKFGKEMAHVHKVYAVHPTEKD